jgi:TetR/AcrR family transcriptional repressor of nem operon
MARHREFDREEVLEKAMRLFWAEGYDATSVRTLLTHLGISSSSLYATFGGKHDLYLAALARYRAREHEEMRALLADAASPRAALAGLFSSLAELMLQDGSRRGSFTLNAAVERGTHDAAVAAQLRAHFDELTELMTDFLAEAQEQGKIDGAAQPRELARFFLQTLYSLATFVKVYPDRERMETITRVALTVLD